MAAANGDVELGLQNGSAGSATGRDSARLRESSVTAARRSTIRSIQSRVSRVASIAPFDFIRNLTKSHCPEPAPALSEADRVARNIFFKVILHQTGVTLSPIEEAERLSAPCVVWYGKFLECRFKGAWTTVTREALRSLSPTFNEPRPGEIGVVYNFMSVAAKLLLEDGHRGLAMVDIVDQADNLHLFKDQKDAQRATPNQLVFAAIGWLTMLYDPEPIPRPGQLKVRKAMGSISHPRTRTRPGRTFIHYIQEGFDDIDQPLFIYLRKFGHLIPEIGAGLAKVPELITVSYVCFSMLDKVADVKIEWVNSLSLHLEFDNVRRVLKIFRFPSFCMLMYRDMTFISNVYLDHSRHIRVLKLEEHGEDLTPEYFREVLLSYRLIFGQDRASWKAFNKKLPTFGERWDCSDKHSDDADPMLRTLCCSSYDSPNANRIYEEIDAPDGISPYYYPDSDFPFLGRRILDLQAFVSGRNPHNWRALWNDKRNVAFWWTFWAVLFIGGGTIFLGFLQTAFQIWGSISAQKQLGPSTSCPTSCP